MFLITAVIIICFYIGFFICRLVSLTYSKHATENPSTFIHDGRNSMFSSLFLRPQLFCKCGILLHLRSYFDPRETKLSLHANENLQKIFDLIIERFIFRWFAKLSDDQKFVVDLKFQLQHICSVILLRVKTVDVPLLIERKLLPCVIHHVEHLLKLTNVLNNTHVFFESVNNSSDDEASQTTADEVILQRLHAAAHLHPALQSRKEESLYLQGIVRCLLSCVILPPGLKPKKTIKTTDWPLNEYVKRLKILRDQAFSSAQFHHQLPDHVMPGTASTAVDDKGPTYTLAAQCALTFLTEVLANHVLLPALDSIANPDSLNTILLYLLDPIADDTDYPPDAPMVPLLKSYIDDWIKSATSLPEDARMEALLHRPKPLAKFVTYMKSINCSTTMTVLLLMFEVINKTETEQVSPELCRKLRSPLHQLLLLLHCGRVHTSETLLSPEASAVHHHDLLPQTCTDCGLSLPPLKAPQLTTPLGLPQNLTSVIYSAILTSDTDPLSVVRLVHTPEWTTAYQTMCSTMETIYLPIYFESAEYLGKGDTGSSQTSPMHSFILPEDPIRKSTTDLMKTRRFYKSPHQSSSFNDLNDLNRRRIVPSGGGGGGGSSSNRRLRTTDDMVATSTANSPSNDNSKLRRQSAGLPSSSATDVSISEIENLDLSTWRVSIPFYSPDKASSARGGLVMNSLRPMLLNSTQPDTADFSLLNIAPTYQGSFNILSERNFNGKQISSRVCRKFTEFYVLEQRLVEFHGSQITCRLHPRRPFATPTHHFLESLKPQLERFLRYLLWQSFLRKSELVYTFLTASNVEFTSSYLSDFRIGKIVKSVPILLAKEKGQYADEFLTLFRSSCFVPPSNQTSNPRTHGDGATRSCGIKEVPNSILDHRLRSKIYWNNSGILVPQIRTSEHCAMEGSYVDSFYDFFGYLVEKFHKPNSESHFCRARVSTPISIAPPMVRQDFSLSMEFFQWISRIVRRFWVTLKVIWHEVTCLLERNGWTVERIPLTRSRLHEAKKATTSSTSPRSSLSHLLRRGIINVGLALRSTSLQPLVNLHLRHQLDHFLRLLVRNDYLAPMLLLLRDSIFFPAPPRSEREKALRRESVSTALRKLITEFHLQWFSDDDILQRRLGRIFELFQHGKWNKQLTYVLLDHILLELFPDVFKTAPPVSTDPLE